MCINKDNCNCLSTRKECDNFGPFMTKNIKCINSDVDTKLLSIVKMNKKIILDIESRKEKLMNFKQYIDHMINKQKMPRLKIFEYLGIAILNCYAVH